MAGYYGYSMSNNAVNDYKNNIKPISKFNKKDLDYFNSFLVKFNIEPLKITVKTFKNWLKENGYEKYHHSSKFYNVVDFYSITKALFDVNDYCLEDFDNEEWHDEDVLEDLEKLRSD